MLGLCRLKAEGGRGEVERGCGVREVGEGANDVFVGVFEGV